MGAFGQTEGMPSLRGGATQESNVVSTPLTLFSARFSL